jgi:outer membrane lipoprotein-sorting protein
MISLKKFDMNTVTQFKQRFGSLKTILFLLGFITLSSHISAQTRPVQDVRRVIVTIGYDIENGQQKDKNYAIEQELFDSLNRKHTEIAFDIKDHYPHCYKWHYYKGKERVKTQIFRNEKMVQVLEFTYKNNQVSQQVVKTVQSKDTSILYILNFTYNSLGNPTKVIAKSPQGKKVYTSSSKFDTNGHELSRKVKTKGNIYPLDSILSLASKPVYNTVGLLASNKIKTSYVNKQKQNIEFRYTYDDKKNLTGIIKLDENGKQLSREERVYHSKIEGRVMQVKYYDANDVLIKSITKRYEIYRAHDLMSRTIED